MGHSGLLACPVLAAMYNSRAFPSLETLVGAALAEKWNGWSSSPAHTALYESKVPASELDEVITGMNLPKSIAGFIVTAVSKDGGAKIFQLHTPRDKHGEATRIRYDESTCIGGFSPNRFKQWWSQLDDDGDDRMSYNEVRKMLASLERSKSNSSAPARVAWVKKSPVFTLLFYTFGGGGGRGVSKSTFESLYRGVWPISELKFPVALPATKAWGNVLWMMMSQKLVA